MRKTIVIAGIFIATFGASVRASTFYDGNEVYDMCLNQPIAAHMYVIGVLDGTDSYSKDGSIKSPVCLAENVVARQIVDVSCNYLRDHPEQRQYTAASTIVVALMKAFPCN